MTINTRLVISGVAMASALGTTTEQNWQGLIQGCTGVRIQQPFPELLPRPLGLIAEQPAHVLRLQANLLRELLDDAALTDPLPDCGVVIGSSRGQQSHWESWLRQRVITDLELQAWWQTLPQSLALAVARTLKTQAPVLSPTAACATGIWCLAQGKLLIESGQCQQVIVGAVEAPITPLTLAGFSRMGALADTGAYPFDRDRQGFALGEGGALMLLETLESARSRTVKIYGEVLGVGLTADARHLTAPDEKASGMRQAVETCLLQAHRSTSELDHIHAHGTATHLNDQAEAQWISQLCPEVLISATKGATGHTLGAAGALAVGFSLLSLQHQVLLPTVGLQHPDFDLNFVTQAMAHPLQTALCCSYGFGGQNAVVALGKWEE